MFQKIKKCEQIKKFKKNFFIRKKRSKWKIFSVKKRSSSNSVWMQIHVTCLQTFHILVFALFSFCCIFPSFLALVAFMSVQICADYWKLHREKKARKERDLVRGWKKLCFYFRPQTWIHAGLDRKNELKMQNLFLNFFFEFLNFSDFL